MDGSRTANEVDADASTAFPLVLLASAAMVRADEDPEQVDGQASPV